MTSNNPLLERVRKLLAKAEAQSVTPAEAEALTAKAAELMARYGIDRALLAAQRPETDHPADRKVDVDNPWARVQAHLLCGLASAMRCRCVILPRSGPGTRIHMFGFGV
jgi:cytosine/adenosine deaminase-related metal-dependent hydrolase